MATDSEAETLEGLTFKFQFLGSARPRRHVWRLQFQLHHDGALRLPAATGQGKDPGRRHSSSRPVASGLRLRLANFNVGGRRRHRVAVAKLILCLSWLPGLAPL